jgi:hypothetical protein
MAEQRELLGGLVRLVPFRLRMRFSWGRFQVSSVFCMPVSTMRPDTWVEPAILVVGVKMSESPLMGTLHLCAISLMTALGGSVSVSSSIIVAVALSW